MTQLKGRRIDEYGKVIFNEDGLCDVLMSGNTISDLLVDHTESIEIFNNLCKQWDHPQDSLAVYEPSNEDVTSYHKNRQSDWFIPERYKSVDIREWLYLKCNVEKQIARVNEELKLFEEREMIPVLQFLIYLVDYMRENNIIWGVGRGSSVASYCLFLIGIHKIDSLKYSLDIREFLK